MSAQPEPVAKNPASPPFDNGPPESESPTNVRYGVLAFLCSMSFILYLDRVCIGQAAPLIERDLNISHTTMSLVLMAFTVAYGLFEVPTGHWGDRYGSRGVLTRIVLWWSFFTMLTGAGTGFLMLVIVRFLFGAGEAGAFPNACRVIARWFPPGKRGKIQGIVVTTALIGGAMSPAVTGAMIESVGWRWTFALLGVPGILWAIAFHRGFRDDPAEHPGVNEAERQLIGGGGPPKSNQPHPPIPWGEVLTNSNIWLLGGITSCSACTTYLVFSWYPTYLQEARGVSQQLSGSLASLVLTGGAIGGTTGGWLSDWMIRRAGHRRSRSRIGATAMVFAAILMMSSIQIDSPWLAALCLALVCFALHLQLAAWWGAVTEISGKHVGALFGLMNSMGVPGAMSSQFFLGVFVDWMKSHGYVGRAQWDPAFYIYGLILLIGATCWLFVDAGKRIGARDVEPPA